VTEQKSLFGTEEPRVDRSGDVFVRVSVERGIDAPNDQGLTYRADPPVGVGDRVEVPLGRGNTRTGGVVIAAGGEELLDGYPASKVKRVLEVRRASLPESLVELARWMSWYYVCPLGMVLATMTPAAVKHAIGRRIRTMVERTDQQPGDARMTPSVKAAWSVIETLDDGVLPCEPKELAGLVGASSVRPINELVKLGLLRHIEREVVKSRTTDWEKLSLGLDSRNDFVLTDQQSAAVEGISGTLDSFGVHLLRGVTGSGKTEVYLRAIDRVLKKGRTALVLVPEIALTPQTGGRFLARFRDEGVAVLHSGLSAAARHEQWKLAMSGDARVVVGARSAVFAPLSNLGIIVIDEEHDSSYKQDQLPRYHARAAAIKRAQIESCPVVLGSATPSLESWLNAERGRFTLHELTERVGGAKLPKVKIVDLSDERRKRAKDRGDARAFHLLGPTLEEAMTETLESNRQVILLVNRRGFASYVACPDGACGWSMRCDYCDAAMVYHKGRDLPKGGLVRCHHCGAEQLLPERCPLCQSRVITIGMGTQRLEEEVTRKFGDRFGLAMGETMLRLDSDAMRGARDYFEALSRFGKGEIRVLLGTQMIAKGLDFPGVGLVGVVSADTALSIPDFRAAERTFQLVSQVAGRTGRGVEPGRVIVQTGEPDMPAIQMAASHDYPSFASSELSIRRASSLPPFKRLARIVTRDKDDAKARQAARDLVEHLRQVGGKTLEVVGRPDAVPGLARRRALPVGGAGDGRHAGRADRRVQRAAGEGTRQERRAHRRRYRPGQPDVSRRLHRETVPSRYTPA